MLVNGFIFAFLAILSSQIEGAKILGIFWTPSKSHHMAGSPLMIELARRGHEVHMISSFNDNNVNIPTYKQELLTGIIGEFDIFIKANSSILNTVSEAMSLNRKLVDRFWQNKPIQKLVKTTPKYDLVIVLSFFNEYTLGIGNILGAPVIVFSSMGTNVVNGQFVGNPNLPYEAGSPVKSYMGNFLKRLKILATNSLFPIFFKYLIHPVQETVSREHFPNMPDIEQMTKNVSLVLVNSHFTLEAPRPYVPNLILIGGYYMQEVKQLPENLRSFMDSATKGAILFSMGSNVNITDKFKKEQLKAIMNGFAKLAPLKVVLKSEIEIPNTPNNVFISKWLPQNDILAHSNIKLFISHCGRGGLTEAVIHGVPILGIPFFADQSENVDFAVEAGFAIGLKAEDLNQETFDSALKELLNNPKYAENVKKRSSVLRNQPIKPMDNAIWWVEHIIEHKGGEHLRNVAMDLEWYQLYMVDLMIFCLAVSAVCLTVSFFIVRWILRKLCRRLGLCKSDDKKVIKEKKN